MEKGKRRRPVCGKPHIKLTVFSHLILTATSGWAGAYASCPFNDSHQRRQVTQASEPVSNPRPPALLRSLRGQRPVPRRMGRSPRRGREGKQSLPPQGGCEMEPPPGSATFIRLLTPAHQRFVACNKDRGAENWSSICRPSRAARSPFQPLAGTSALHHK